MARELLDRLQDRMVDDLDGLERSDDCLRFRADARFAPLVGEILHDVAAEMLRVCIVVTVPAGAGTEFLVWCLSANAKYWDVKFGLDEQGRLLVHSDLDAHRGVEIDRIANAVVERAETVVDLIDDDLIMWLMARGLGTPAQHTRWQNWAIDKAGE